MNTELAQSLASEVSQLMADLEKDLIAAKTNADASVITAWKIGIKCIEAKATVGHGAYGAWLEGVGLAVTTAFRYSALASKFPTLEDLKSANGTRSGYLALLVPEKEQIEHEGDISLIPPTHHNLVINAFMKWKRRVDIGKITLDANAVERDMRPLWEWLNPYFSK